jgi:hypothetical protein
MNSIADMRVKKQKGDLLELHLEKQVHGGDGSILLRSKYLQRYTSTKIKFLEAFLNFFASGSKISMII